MALQHGGHVCDTQSSVWLAGCQYTYSSKLHMLLSPLFGEYPYLPEGSSTGILYINSNNNLKKK